MTDITWWNRGGERIAILGRSWKNDQTGGALWRARDYLEVIAFPANWVSSLAALSVDGRYFASANGETVRLWNTATPNQPLELRHETRVTDIRMSPDGRRVATIAGSIVRILNTDGSGVPLALNHESTVTTLAFSGDSRAIVTASLDGIARVWRIDWSTLLSELQTRTNALCLSEEQRARYFLETGA
jgi:WD40 repeat protein